MTAKSIEIPTFEEDVASAASHLEDWERKGIQDKQLEQSIKKITYIVEHTHTGWPRGLIMANGVPFGIEAYHVTEPYHSGFVHADIILGVANEKDKRAKGEAYVSVHFRGTDLKREWILGNDFLSVDKGDGPDLITTPDKSISGDLDYIHTLIQKVQKTQKIRPVTPS